MYQGELLENFFTERGNFEENSSGEASVLCPFLHTKKYGMDYETRPSAHVNVKKATFHCKTCQAEGRFNEGGLSEVGFIAEIYKMPYSDAVKLTNLLQENEVEDREVWNRAAEGLLTNEGMLTYLYNRGITLETIKKYGLAFRGDGIGYPITLYGQLCDIRTYSPNDTPKMRSQRGATPLLFPFDTWRYDETPTILTAGENDCLLIRQMGFNGLTVTGGEGSFPKILVKMFNGKTVYICYDCDVQGKKAARTIAFLLREAGAVVHIMDLGLPGEKDDKDITDFIMKHGSGRDEFVQKINEAKLYDGEAYQEDKNEHYPLIDLWQVPEGRFSGKRVSSRVVLSGVYDQVMQIPTMIDWECKGAKFFKDSPCWSCPLNMADMENPESLTPVPNDGWWALEDDLKELMYLVDVDEGPQTKSINKLIGMPDKCPNGRKIKRTMAPVYKVIFTPDVETENVDSNEDFRATEQYAYTLNMNLEDGARYRAFFKSYPHPLDGQRVFMVVDRVEESDNAINTFKMSPPLQKELAVFQGDPTTMMQARAEMAKDIVGSFAQDMIVYAVDLMYHSPLKFTYHGRTEKGYPEGLVAGDTRTGKSKHAEHMLKYYGIGNFTSVKRATTAGLLGGAEKLPSGGFKVSWGTIPRNNKGIVFLDEMSDCGLDVIASLTDMRSSSIATVSKIAKGKAPANTRMLWMSNPRKDGSGHNMQVQDYPTGIKVVLDLVGATEDIARFDFIMLIPEGEIISPILDAPVKAHDAKLYKNLIYWAWSRSAEQVTWGEGVEAYVWQVSQELNEAYNTDVKFFGAEAWKKLARIAVSCAACCFSCSSDGESIVVLKSHVDWASNFLRSCYDNNVFRLAEYVRDKRVYNETNESVNAIVAGMCRNQPMLIKSILQSSTPFPRFNLQSISGLDNDSFNKVMADLTSNYLVTASSQGFLPTRRLRKAVEVYRADYSKSRMPTLAEGDGIPV